MFIKRKTRAEKAYAYRILLLTSRRTVVSIMKQLGKHLMCGANIQPPIWPNDEMCLMVSRIK